ncbi:MAG: DUF2064 domain-containing protein [Leptolyngbya sp. SIO1D8]|nr:DUF2064 domain-containing protein [Leptolyngbya sp. SIO1D8]
MNKALTINDTDNVAVALTDLLKDEIVQIDGEELSLTADIKAKHKIALKDFAEGEKIYMYGVIVGEASEAIGKGQPITTENVVHHASSYELENRKQVTWDAPDVSKWRNRTFNGYHRRDGQVGTANYWLVFPLVFCENRNIEVIKKTFEKTLGLEKEVQYEAYLRSLVEQYRFNGGDLKDTEPPPIPEVTNHISDKPELFAELAYRPQCSGDLGHRLQRTFDTGFRTDLDRIVVIGADCPEITTHHLEQAFDQLKSHDVVLGPAQDGGYYLVGLSQICADLFQGIAWGTGQVFRQTVAIAARLNLSLATLETLRDVDYPEDISIFEQALCCPS